jgi:putative ABC transport system permease protein
VARVDPGFFDAFDKPILAGRGFDRHDAAATSSAVIVNTAFVSEVLNGRNPIGRRIRYSAIDGGDADRWYEIVGVVGPLGIDIMATEEKAGLYHPLAPGETQPYLAVHVVGDPAAFTTRLRAIAGEVDATAVITGTIPLEDIFEGDWYFLGAIVLGGVLLIGILVALAASAIYAMMSFAVTQRTREIGIRAALGADAGRLVLTITRRTAVQLGLGAVCGVPLAVFLFTGLSDGPQQASDLLALLPGILAVLAIGALACAAPARRALRIAPTEALRDG